MTNTMNSPNRQHPKKIIRQHPKKINKSNKTSSIKSNKDDWTRQDTKNLFKAFGWLGGKLLKTTLIVGATAGIGIVGLGALSATKEADYPLE